MRIFVYFLYFFSLFLFPHLQADEKLKIPIESYEENVRSQRGKVAIASLFQNEASFLREWIEFHQMIGVSHFYLYNNLSQDDYWSVLESYVKDGTVELFDVPFDTSVFNDGAHTHNQVQTACYNHALKKAKDRFKWLALIDSDEFIVPIEDMNLPELLYQYDGAVAVVVYWQMYGTSRVKDLLPDELMIEKLLYKYPAQNANNHFYKMIVKPEYNQCKDPHWCKIKEGYFGVFPNGERFSRQYSPGALPIQELRINHYTNRTISFYEQVKKPRRADWGYHPSPDQEFKELLLSNSTYDPVMLRYVPELRQRMFGME